MDIGTCFLCADYGAAIAFSARREGRISAGCAVSVSGQLCGAALTETLEDFLYRAGVGFCSSGVSRNERSPRRLGGMRTRARRRNSFAARWRLLLCALIVLCVAWQASFARERSSRQPAGSVMLYARRSTCRDAVSSLAPLVPWALRNRHTLHRFEPLAPRYANEEDEFVPMGFNRWVKTWIADYASVEEIYWPVPGARWMSKSSRAAPLIRQQQE